MRLKTALQAFVASAVLAAGLIASSSSEAASCGGSATWDTTLNPATCNGHSSMFLGAQRGQSNAALATSVWSGNTSTTISGYTSGGLYACGVTDSAVDGNSVSVQGGGCVYGTWWTWTINY